MNQISYINVNTYIVTLFIFIIITIEIPTMGCKKKVKDIIKGFDLFSSRVGFRFDD